MKHKLDAGLGPVPDTSCRELQIPNDLLRPSTGPALGGDQGTLVELEQAQSRPCSRVAYIMHTSGSAGHPKAVRGTMEGVPCHTL